MRPRSTLVALLLLALALGPAVMADSDPAPSDPPGLSEQVDRLFGDFLSDILPRLQHLEEGLAQIEPEMQALLERFRALSQYHPPEILPNGDILIRRRTEPDTDPSPDAEPPQDDAAPQDHDDAAEADPPFEL